MSVSLIIGPMFSGKSTELFRRIRREQYAGKRTIIYKYVKDMRYTTRQDLACSHDGVSQEAVPVSTLEPFIDNLPDVDVIGIDEGQFIACLEQFCQTAANAGITVIIAALDSNYKRESFQNVTNLVGVSEHVRKLHSVCIMCGKKAAFTRKLLINKKTSIEDIGGADKYIASCRRCFTADIPAEVLQKYRLQFV